jgi:hypothetical protein
MHFPVQHLTFDMEMLDVPEDYPTSSIQLVVRYLKVLRENTIDTEEVDLTAEQISETECRGLLSRYFLAGDHVASPSMRLLDTFVRVLADQLRHLS